MADYLLLDTNALPVRGNFQNSFWSALFHVCETKAVSPALSEVTLNEATSLRARTADEAIEALISAHSRLSSMTRLPPIYAPTGDDVRDEYASILRQRFVIVPLSGAAAIEALAREAQRIRPAREGKGARDAAIWLSVKRLLGTGSQVHFVTNNSKDFGKGALHEDLAHEISRFSARFHYYSSPNDFLGAIATKLTAPTLTTDEIRDAFADSIRSRTIDLLEMIENDDLTAERALNAHVAVSELRFPQTYKVDKIGLSLATGSLTLADDQDRPTWASGQFTGWLSFDPVTQTATVSDIDELNLLFR